MMEQAPLSTLDRKQRLQIPPQTIPKQDPQERITNWDEVCLELDLDTARLEATRCIQCPAAPCTKACPIHNDIPAALARLERGDVMGAAAKFRETSHMPEMCGRLCPQEVLCEGACVVGKKALPVAIGRLEAFVADQQRKRQGWPLPQAAPPTRRKVAVVGSGPAGLVVAEEMAKRGHAVTVYEAWPLPGGILRYGIPRFKMDKAMLDEKIEMLRKLGVQFVTNTLIGWDITVDDLFEAGSDAVFLGYGVSQGMKMSIPGEDLKGVFTATEFLVRGNLPPEHLPLQWRAPIHPGRRAVVVGGGDTSMDCVRTALRLGARKVVCVYRRTEAEMLGRVEERRHSREEGIEFMFLTTPIRLLGDESGHVKAVRCVRMELGEPDESGRPRPVPVLGSEFEIAADTVAIAIGYRPDRLILHTTPDLEAEKSGILVVDPETGRTTRPGIFAGGDIAHGAEWVVTALADGKRAAAAIDEYLRRKELGET